MRSLCSFAAIFLLPIVAVAHIGSPNIILEGRCGAHPVRVVIRPPPVIPGIAEISIKVEGPGIRRVTALPVFWQTGKKGAPPPDVAKLIPGETNRYSAELWLMAPGAYSVHVRVEADDGAGEVIVPVNAVATIRRDMPVAMGIILSTMGILLFLLAVRLTGAAFSQALMEPGASPTPGARVAAWVGGGLALLVIAGGVTGGKLWWDQVDRDYRNNRLYKPVPVTADVRTEREVDVLRLHVDNSGRNGRFWTPLIPDHGKLMHLFLLREPEQDIFAHLHPVQRNSTTFECVVPPVPPGRYAIIADVTHESGFAQTLTAEVEVKQPGSLFAYSLPRTNSVASAKGTPADPFCSTPVANVANTNWYMAPDPDDSWHIGKQAASPAAGARDAMKSCPLDGGFTMIWEAGAPLAVGREVSLKVRVLAPDGSPAKLEPYIGMFGHAAVRRDDGKVFAHLHPVGTISMASQHAFEKREQQAASTKVAGGAVSNTPAMATPKPHAQGLAESAAFPYEFPQPGAYRIWVQVKVAGRPLTGVFDAKAW